MLLAILSDTHSLLRPELLAALRDPARTPDHILHAGDVGDPAILGALRAIAPVTAIRGNIDTSGPCAALPATEALELAGCLLYMLHNLADLDLNPAAAGISVVIHGHSHQPAVETRNNVLYLNPGSAGPRRFSLPITFARLYLKDAHPTAELVSLQPPAQTS
jgi:putative phosphoesterase